MWEALAHLTATLEAVANVTCPPKFYLSSLDPGVGKSETVAHFLRALLVSPDHNNVSAVVCVSRLSEVRSYAERIGLPDTEYAALTADDEINKLGSGEPSKARVLFTTQQMLERRCRDKTFADTSVFHWRGRVRQVRIWDESILPGRGLTLNRDDIAVLIKPLRGPFPQLTQTLERLFAELPDIDDGSVYDLPDFAQVHGVDANGVLRVLDALPVEQQTAASTLWLLSGKSVVIRRDGAYGNTLLDYEETLPRDLAPVVILDASGRVRGTYGEWERSRGNLVKLKAAHKSYRNLTVHVWQRSGGKTAFVKSGKVIADAIASTINTKPDEEWLVVCHQPKIGRFDVAASVGDLLTPRAGQVHFITWGNHHATNEFRSVPNVILAGTLFYRPSYYESLGRLASGRSAASGVYPHDSLHRIIQGEHRHLILQALCRGAVRQCREDACALCHAYIIASVRSGILESLSSVFPDCRIQAWQPVHRALKGKVKDAVEYIKKWMAANPQGLLRFREVMSSVGINDTANFRTDVRQHEDFVEAIEELGLVEHGYGIYPRGFMRAAEALGFEVEDGYVAE